MNFGCVQAGGVIYVCGGLGDGEAFNDLWLSRDLGVTWECILGNIDFYCYEGSKGHFPSRAMFGFAYLPCDDVLLVYGGTDRIDNYNDVWSARRAALDEVREKTQSRVAFIVPMTSHLTSLAHCRASL